MSELRELTPSDLDHCAKLLARAFRNNPAMVCIIGHDEVTRSTLLEQFCRTLLRIYLKEGTARGALVDGQVRSVMLGLGPGSYPLSFWAELSLAVTALRWGGWSITRRMAATEAIIKPEHIKGPHHYVYMLGTDPDFQHRGLASGLLKRLATEAGSTPRYLETDDPKNIPFYQRHNFAVRGERAVALGDHGFQVWFLSAVSSTQAGE
jgi:ribosomal protein S18 acetylase RimI-like enzyme